MGGACPCTRLELEAQGAVGNRFWTSPTSSLRQQATTASEGKCRRLGAGLAAWQQPPQHMLADSEPANPTLRRAHLSNVVGTSCCCCHGSAGGT